MEVTRLVGGQLPRRAAGLRQDVHLTRGNDDGSAVGRDAVIVVDAPHAARIDLRRRAARDRQLPELPARVDEEIVAAARPVRRLVAAVERADDPLVGAVGTHGHDNALDRGSGRLRQRARGGGKNEQTFHGQAPLQRDSTIKT